MKTRTFVITQILDDPKKPISFSTWTDEPGSDLNNSYRSINNCTVEELYERLEDYIEEPINQTPDPDRPGYTMSGVVDLGDREDKPDIHLTTKMAINGPAEDNDTPF